MTRRLPRLTAAILSLGALAAGSQGAAQASFSTGVSGYELQSADPGRRSQGVGEAVETGAKFARIGVSWAGIAAGKPTNAADPADPAYRFDSLDAAVISAASGGLQPLLTINSAPSFAEGKNRPSSASQGSWRPDGEAFGQFAHALAERYSGSFQGLPHVRFYEAWNEPNLSTFLAPQYVGKKAVAPEIYRGLLNGFYAGVKGVDRSNVVISGGTAPYGDPPGGERTRPLTFLRDLLCVRDGRGSRARPCPRKAKFDVLAHHPINTSGGPTRSAIDPDDASTPDFKNVRSILREAERRHLTGTPGEHPLWATEIWWESNPPAPKFGIPLSKQAQFIEQALYVLWKQGASVVINQEIRDPASGNDADTLFAGLFFSDGRKKPAFTAFRFPLVTQRVAANKVRVWGRPPLGGRLSIQLEHGKSWRTVKKLSVGAGKVFLTKLKLRGNPRLRAVVAGERSLPWSQG